MERKVLANGSAQSRHAQPRPHTKNERPRAAAASADPLTHYLNDLRRFDVLSAAEERAMAEDIERCEIAHWRALLDHRDVPAWIASAVAPHFAAPKALGSLHKRRARTHATDLDTLAAELRALDSTRVALFEADAAVRARLATEHAAADYLRRVERARLAQQAAKNRFMTANLRLVVSLARRYKQELLPLGDLIQEGNLGLMRAVERFDYRRGFRFSTYAAWWIRHGLNRALSDKGRLIRVPVHLLDDAQRVAHARTKLSTSHAGAPSLAELAAATGLSEEKVALTQSHAHVPKPTSLDRKLSDDGEASLLDILVDPTEPEPEQELDAVRWPAHLRQLLRELTPIEASVLSFRFGLQGGEELTLREIGDKYNLSRERIRQLEAQALDKLRAELSRQGLDSAERNSAA